MSATTGGELVADRLRYVYARRAGSRWHIVPVPWPAAPALCGQRPLWTTHLDQLPSWELEYLCYHCQYHERRLGLVKERGWLWGSGEVRR